jgi:predicted aspartyl protease
MESEPMGRVTTEVLIESLKDLWAVELGVKPAEEVRRVTVPDAMVDTGASTLSLPTSMIQQLGLAKVSEKRGRSSVGLGTFSVYEVVRATILGRSCVVEVIELPDGSPVLVGQLPLEMLDLVPDPRRGIVTTNPAHGGELLIDMF